jgi:hypothetical protein
MERITTGPDPEKLANCAYSAADQYRDGKLSETAALEWLKACCPGYTKAEYDQAFAEGMFESR